jgi:hypothetical protein
VVAVIGTGMSLRESMVFSAFSSAKACTDHGGYQFPWNPVDLFTTVGAAYHDKHHQRWGYKVSSPFLSFAFLLPNIVRRAILHFTSNSGIEFWGPSSRTPKLHLDCIHGTAKQRRWLQKRKRESSNLHKKWAWVQLQRLKESSHRYLLHPCPWNRIVATTVKYFSSTVYSVCSIISCSAIYRSRMQGTSDARRGETRWTP